MKYLIRILVAVGILLVLLGDLDWYIGRFRMLVYFQVVLNIVQDVQYAVGQIVEGLVIVIIALIPAAVVLLSIYAYSAVVAHEAQLETHRARQRKG